METCPNGHEISLEQMAASPRSLIDLGRFNTSRPPESFDESDYVEISLSEARIGDQAEDAELGLKYWRPIVNGEDLLTVLHLKLRCRRRTAPPAEPVSVPAFGVRCPECGALIELSDHERVILQNFIRYDDRSHVPLVPPTLAEQIEALEEVKRQEIDSFTITLPSAPDFGVMDPEVGDRRIECFNATLQILRRLAGEAEGDSK